MVKIVATHLALLSDNFTMSKVFKKHTTTTINKMTINIKSFLVNFFKNFRTTYLLILGSLFRLFIFGSKLKQIKDSDYYKKYESND